MGENFGAEKIFCSKFRGPHPLLSYTHEAGASNWSGETAKAPAAPASQPLSPFVQFKPHLAFSSLVPLRCFVMFVPPSPPLPTVYRDSGASALD